MLKSPLFALIVIMAIAGSVHAHPHAFVECRLAFVMDKQGLVGFREHWTLDEMTSVAVLDVVDTNRDGVLSPKEKIAVRDLSVNSLLAYHYFTVARINGRNFPVRAITDFSTELKSGKLSYEFLVPCRVKAFKEQSQKVQVAVYDDSFYTFVVYVEEGDGGMDPIKDPLFANKAAPAKPGDFKRFSNAIGLEKFKGDVQIQGNAANFSITSTVQDEPEMAYFYGQIVPQAFVLAFALK